jgi:hypothetical protein
VHVVVVALMGSRRNKTPLPVIEKNPATKKLACAGCGCACHKTVFGTRGAQVLCYECSRALLNGESRDAVMRRGKEK